MNADELTATLATMLNQMPADLRRQCEQEINDGRQPPGIRLAHRSARRYEVVWCNRHIGSVFIPASFWESL